MEPFSYRTEDTEATEVVCTATGARHPLDGTADPLDAVAGGFLLRAAAGVAQPCCRPWALAVPVDAPQLTDPQPVAMTRPWRHLSVNPLQVALLRYALLPARAAAGAPEDIRLRGRPLQIAGACRPPLYGWPVGAP
jgi:hypothetical protein